MAVKVKTKTGKQVTLLNPAEKGRKYAAELKTNMHLTNEGTVKLDVNGEPLQLTPAQRAHRSGYLSARQDSADCYNAQHGKPKRKRQWRSKGTKNNRSLIPIDGDFEAY